MIERVTYALVFAAFGAALMLTYIASRPSEPERQPLKRTFAVPALSPVTYTCTREEINEHLRACSARKRMEAIKSFKE